MKRRLFACVLVAPLACAAAVSRITLGLVAPPSEPDATSLVRAVRLAVEESGESPGAPVALEVRGESGQWGTVGNDAVTLASDRDVDAMIAPPDGASSHLVLQVSGRMQVPVVCLCPDASVTEAGVPWAVRVVPRIDQQAEALFAARRPALPAAWWALVPPDRPGRAARRDLAKAARSAGTALDRILDIGTDPASVARQVAAGSPGGVLVWLAPSQAGVAAAALRAAGYQGCVAGPCSIDAPEFVAAAGAAADGVLVAEYEGDSGSRARLGRFEERFMGRFGVRPGYGAAAAHDAAQVLIENLRRAGDTPAYRRFPPALPTPGVTGEIRFDTSGNRTGALQVLTCQRGRFVPTTTLNP